MSECKAASLELKAITKNYGAQRALHETTLSIPAGRFTSILGPSGCGKSTTLMLIAGLERPTSGCVLVDGADVTDTPVEKRGIGIVFQNYALFPNLSVEENILYGLRARGADEAVRRNRLREMLELTHLEGLAHRFPAQLSGGQQQRVAIARALAPNPRLLLLDEPLSALDAWSRSAIGEQLKAIQQASGVTTVMVTHDRQEALSRGFLRQRYDLEKSGGLQRQRPCRRNRFFATTDNLYRSIPADPSLRGDFVLPFLRRMLPFAAGAAEVP